MKHENIPSNKEPETSINGTVRRVIYIKWVQLLPCNYYYYYYLYNLLKNNLKQKRRGQLINIDSWERGKINKILD